MAARIRLAVQADAHADPLLDLYPHLGPVTPCLLCGTGLPQRHRIVDAIAGHLAAGEDAADIADEFSLPITAVNAVAAWAARWEQP